MNLLTRHKSGEMKSKRKVENLYEKVRIPQKGLGTVLEELKQRVLAKVAKQSIIIKELSNISKIESLLLIRKTYLLK